MDFNKKYILTTPMSEIPKVVVDLPGIGELVLWDPTLYIGPKKGDMG